MKKRCPSSTALCTASKENTGLCYPVKSEKRENMGVASIRYEQGRKVEGVIYRLTLEDLENLDKFEGNCKRYNRKKIYVSLSDNLKKLVWTYIAASDSSNYNRPSEQYLGLIIEGAKENNLSQEYINYLIKSPANDFFGKDNN